SCRRLIVVLLHRSVLILLAPFRRLVSLPVLFLLLPPRPPVFSLFPYTTLFRSGHLSAEWDRRECTFPLSGAVCRDIRCLRRGIRSEEHTSEFQSRFDLVCRLLLEKKKMQIPKSESRQVLPQ